MSETGKTILIAVSQGFAFRYIIQTDIFKKLKENRNNKIIFAVPDLENSFIKSLADENVFIEKYHFEECRKYIVSSKIEQMLKDIRAFILNEKGGDITTVRELENIYFSDNEKNFSGLKGLFRKILMKILIKSGRRSRMVRRLIVNIEQKYFTPKIHREIFNKYSPDALLVTSLGNFDYDQYFMREAREKNVQVISIILSWDNTTVRGLAGGIPDKIIAWTDVMKEELLTLHDYKEDQVFVGGVAHFDHYFQEKTFYERNDFCEKLGLDPKKKIVFFATKSPNGYPCNHDVARIIQESINEKRFIEPVQLIVRLHPIYFKKGDKGLLFKWFLEQFKILKKNNPDMIINEPKVLPSFNFLMPDEEIRLLASINKYADVCVNLFSTLNVEESIFDVPMVNVCFEGDSYDRKGKARYDIELDFRQTHNQRIVKSNGIRIARNKTSMIDHINEYLKDPSLDKEGRKTIYRNETGPYHGNAGDMIADYILRC